jgi:heme/copper-type cytochrome/quinol oxidase subunit 3
MIAKDNWLWLLAAIILGTIFLSIQGYEYFDVERGWPQRLTFWLGFLP